MFQYEATMLRVVDGDTVWLNVDLGFRVRIEEVFRLAYINAPEKVNFTLEGVQDRAATHILRCIPQGAVCIADITKTDKYGRWLAVLRYLPGVRDRAEILARGINLNDELVRLGLAKRYKA
jgi:micrococcal nuclease